MAIIQYRPEIDGLRAIAVLAVICFHAFPDVFPGGFVGVDVFFVISGFLITSILLQEASIDGIRLARFYAKRILRIFPALTLVLLACLVFGWHTLLGAEYKQLGQHIFSGTMFVSNFTLWFEVNYFDNAAHTKPLLHLWSLGIEEQFYIFWPLLLALFVRKNLTLHRLILIPILLSLAYACIVVFYDRNEAFYSPFSRAWELLSGAILGCLSNNKSSSMGKRLKYPSIAWLGLTMILISIFALTASSPFPGTLAIPAVLGTVLLIAAGPDNALNAHVLSHPWMVGMGRISYPLYLWHWPLLSFSSILLSGYPSLPVRAGVVVASFLLAILTYQLVEKPLHRLPFRAVVWVLLSGMALLALLGRNIEQRDGMADIRYKTMVELTPEAQKDFMDWEKSGLITDHSCEIPFQFPGRSYCVKRHPDQTPTAAVIGDSHAFHAYWGLAQVLDERGDNLIAVGRGACVPFVHYAQGDDTDGCQPHVDRMLAYAVDTPAIRDVFLIFRGRYLPNEASPSSVIQFRDALDLTLDLFREAGKQVYYFLPVIETGFDPRLCLGGLPFGRLAPQSCVLSRTEDASRALLLRQQVELVLKRHPEVRLLDPNDYLCQGDACPVLRSGHTMFKDENHLSYSGSMYLARAMYDNLAK